FESVATDGSITLGATFEDVPLLALFCEICLETNLRSCALNLALQCHILDRSAAINVEEQTRHTPNPIVVRPMGRRNPTAMDDDYLSVDHTPVGLSADLWSRVHHLCSSQSAYVARNVSPPVLTNGNKRDQLSNGTNGGNNHDAVTNGNDPHPDELVASSAGVVSHFLQVNDFSVKEEQLRAQVHASQNQSGDSEDSQVINPISNDLTVKTEMSEDTAAVINDDYLTGAYAEVSHFIPHRNGGEVDYDWDSFTDGSPPITDAAKGSQVIPHTAAGSESSRPTELVKQPNGDGESVPGPENFSPARDDDESQNHIPTRHLESSPVVMRRTSILRPTNKSTDEAFGERPKTVHKHVRFSLGSAHPSPALEAEYGGRSNRRRLIDFARRRQMLANNMDPSEYVSGDLLYTALLPNSYSLVSITTGLLKRLIGIFLFPVHVRFVVLVWFFLILLFTALSSLWVCCSTLHLPLADLISSVHNRQKFDAKLLTGQTPSSSVEHVCISLLHWLVQYMPDFLGH
ncbi:unnamed protein product, partial [Calicophoron daubneyi]